jgi:uncharacterized membrane protein HdeD (DUF308 family)
VRRPVDPTHRAREGVLHHGRTRADTSRDPERAEVLDLDEGRLRMDVTYVELGGVSDRDVRADLRTFGRAWWLLLVLGLVWIFVSLLVLQFDQTSINTITAIVGIVFFIAAFEEILHALVVPGWRWLHAGLGVLFVAGGVWSFAYPTQTFGTLALLLGWVLLIWGTFEIVAALMNRDVDLWWLELVTGIVMVLLAFWAVGYPGRSGYLLVLWVGLGALFRGIGRIVLAFQVRHLAKAAA